MHLRGLNRGENKEIPSEIFVILNNIASPFFFWIDGTLQRDGKGPLLLYAGNSGI